MRKLLIFLIVLALISAGIITVDKHRLETENKTVELVMDYELLRQEDQISLLKKLKQNGLTSLGVNQKSLHQLAEEKKLVLLSGAELKLIGRFSSQIKDVKPNNLYISGDFNLLKQIKDNLNWAADEVKLTEDLLIISNYSSELIEKPLFFDYRAVEKGIELDLNLIPRINGDLSPVELRKVINDSLQFKQIIFSGDQVIGYPDRLIETADILEEYQIILGIIEPFIASQQGVEELARLINLKAVRVHSLQQQELIKLGEEELINRYLRAVKERGVRNLYLKPFSKEKRTLTLVKGLSKKLLRSGYKLGSSKPYPDYQPPFYLLIIVLLGVVALIGLIGDILKRGLAFNLFAAISIGIIITAVLTSGLVLPLTALLTAVIIPFFIFLLLERLIKYKINNWGLFFLAGGISICGGILITGLLASTEYLLQIKSFRGVKISFILPLILSGSYYLAVKYANNWKEGWLKLKEFLVKPITWKEIIIGSLVLGIGIIYISRTGNVSIFGIGRVELTARRVLEDIFPVRPRFKSFLLGHPLFWLGITYSLERKEYSWLLLPGLIGQINILNTFAHLHTPFVISLIRVLEGLLLGAAVGIFLFQTIKKLYSL